MADELDAPTDYRATLNLPDTPFPMRGDLPQARARLGRGRGRRKASTSACARRATAAAVRPARRPAVRQRPAPHRPRGQQDPQGHDRQGAPAGRLRRALRAGLGLPRPADREPDREDLRPRPAARRRAGEVPRLRRPSRSRSRWPTSSAWACSATGTIRTGRWTSATRPARSACSKRIVERGFVYRGLKPVYWCFDCGSSLAEFEIEYADQQSPPSTSASPPPTRRGSPPPSACPRCAKDASP